MIGDTIETRIRCATDLGFQSVLVLTGSTKIEDLKNYPFGPTRVCGSIAEVITELSSAA